MHYDTIEPLECAEVTKLGVSLPAGADSLSMLQQATAASDRGPHQAAKHFEETHRKRGHIYVADRPEQIRVVSMGDTEGPAELDSGEGVDFDSVMDEADAIIVAAKQRRTENAG